MEKTNTMTTIYERLRALQINLPDLPPPVVDGYVPSFVPFVRAGNLIYLSGRLAKKDGKPFSGKVGQEITTAEGRQAARDVAIELLIGSEGVTFIPVALYARTNAEFHCGVHHLRYQAIPQVCAFSSPKFALDPARTQAGTVHRLPARFVRATLLTPS